MFGITAECSEQRIKGDRNIMKWIMMAVVMAGLAGAAGAAEFSDLQRLRASGLTAQAAGNWPPRPAPGLKAAKTVVDLYSVDLTAADGTRIFVDYAPVNLGARVIASPVWVSAYNPKFSGAETVKAELRTYYEATDHSADALKETAELQLSYNGWDFQVKAPDVGIYEAHPSWHHTFRQEVAVSVDGAWLTDRVSGTSGFRFKLAENPAGDSSSVKAAGKTARACLFKETQGETCAYKCEGGTSYTRPLKKPGPWNDEPVVPCPQVVFTF